MSWCGSKRAWCIFASDWWSSLGGVRSDTGAWCTLGTSSFKPRGYKLPRRLGSAQRSLAALQHSMVLSCGPGECLLELG